MPTRRTLLRIPVLLLGLALLLPAAYIVLAQLRPSPEGPREVVSAALRFRPVSGPGPAGEGHRPAWAAAQVAQATCASCHETENGYVREPDHFLNRRAGLDRQAWADSALLAAKCASCHVLPDPDQLSPEWWGDAIANYMSKVIYYFGGAPTFDPPPSHLPYKEWMGLTRDQWMDVLHYYFVYSEEEAGLPPDPAVSGMPFEAVPLGAPPAPPALPQIGHVNVLDLDRDGRLDVLVSDFSGHAISWIHRADGRWQEDVLATAQFPGHAEAGDFNGDGHLDIVVADLGSPTPTDNLVGRVLLLTGDGRMHFERQTLLQNVGRVADARPGDFDQDGDIDFVVAVFGFLKEGEIGLLEQTADGRFAYRRLSDQAGTVHVPPVDLDGDGKLDFIALISQEHEEVVAFLNQGEGRFDQRVLFKAGAPTFGSSGIELADLDQDGDVDILYTNGDAFDLSVPMVRPYHGVQWLENRGDFQFVFHDLIRLYGAYRALPGDLDGDGDLDVVAVSLLSDWADPARLSILWLENDGQQQFTPHGIGTTPTSLITAALGDLDEDGRLDIVTGGMHNEPAGAQRPGRVTLWKNAGSTPP